MHWQGVATKMVLGVVATTLVIASADAQPNSSPTVTNLFRQAEVHFYQGKYGQAKGLYLQAYGLRSDPTLLVNVGQCHHYLGEYQLALNSFQKFLTDVPNSPDRAFVERVTRQTEVDMMLHKPAPKIPPQGVTLQLRENGPTLASVGQKGWSVPLWTGIGLGTVLLVAGTTTGILSIAASRNYNNKPGPQTEEERQDLLSLRSRGRAFAITSWATLGATAVLGAALCYWFVYGSRASENSASAGILPLPGGIAASVGAVF